MKRVFCVFFFVLACLSQGIRAQGLNLSTGTEFYQKAVVWGKKENMTSFAGDKSCRLKLNEASDGTAECALIDYTVDETKNYSIDMDVAIKAGAKGNCQTGIFWGAKNWQNFAMFSVLRGKYKATAMLQIWRNGVQVCCERNTAPFRNAMTKEKFRMKVVRQNGKFRCFLGGQCYIVADAYQLSGSKHGLVGAGRGTFALYDFKITETNEEIVPSPVGENKSTDNGAARTSVDNGADRPMEVVGSGTGFFIDKRGYLATNHHVIEDAGAIGVCLQVAGEWKMFNGVVVRDEPTNDLAIIKIDDVNFKAFDHLPYAFSFDTEDVAAEAYTLGYPQVQVMGADVKYTTGVINARTGIQGDPTHYQISTHIDHGNSGGPLFNKDGCIIGITDSGLDKATFGDVNYAVKSSYLKTLAEALPVKLEFPNDKSITSKPRTEQIKLLSPYVALILIAK